MNCLCINCTRSLEEKIKASHVEMRAQVFLAMPLPNGIYAQIILHVPVGKHVEFDSKNLQPLREILDLTVDHFREVENQKAGQ